MISDMVVKMTWDARCLLALFLVAGLGLLSACIGGAASGTPQMSATSGPLNSPLVVAAPTANQTAVYLQTMSSVATKTAILATVDAQERAPRPTPLPPGARLPTMAPPPTIAPRPLPTRLIPQEYGGEPAGDGFITILMDPTGRKNHLSHNVWYMDSPDGLERLAVFAGGPSDFSSGRTGPEGDLLVYRYRVDPVTGTITVTEAGTAYHTPQATGIVKITGATGDVLELVSTTGVVFHFDVANRVFVR